MPHNIIIIYSRTEHIVFKETVDTACHNFAKKISQIGMVSHNMTLLKMICILYQFHHCIRLIINIDRGQIQFREYVSAGTEPKHDMHSE